MPTPSSNPANSASSDRLNTTGETPVFTCLVYVQTAEDGTVTGRVANLAADPSCEPTEAITASGASERSVLSKVMGAFKVRVAQFHELGEAIPWIDPPLPRLENEQIRSVPMHL